MSFFHLAPTPRFSSPSKSVLDFPSTSFTGNPLFQAQSICLYLRVANVTMISLAFGHLPLHASSSLFGQLTSLNSPRKTPLLLFFRLTLYLRIFSRSNPEPFHVFRLPDPNEGPTALWLANCLLSPVPSCFFFIVMRNTTRDAPTFKALHRVLLSFEMLEVSLGVPFSVVSDRLL